MSTYKLKVAWEPDQILVRCDANPQMQSRDGLPLSVVIPTMGSPRRIANLARLIGYLLLSPAMRHPKAEVVLNHGCARSYKNRHSLSKLIRQELPSAHLQERPGDLQNLSKSEHANVPKVTHMLGPREEMFVASRFFAMAAAHNEVVVSIDDDIMPFQSQSDLVAALHCSVRQEPGFPTYYAQNASPGLYGPSIRHCTERGYRNPKGEGELKKGSKSTCIDTEESLVILTNFAACSRHLASRFTEEFDAKWKDVMLRAHGNGEDLIFAIAAKAFGSRMHGVDGHVRTKGARSVDSFSKQTTHYYARRALCCCARLGFAGAELARCALAPVANASLVDCLCGRHWLKNPRMARTHQKRCYTERGLPFVQTVDECKGQHISQPLAPTVPLNYSLQQPLPTAKSGVLDRGGQSGQVGKAGRHGDGIRKGSTAGRDADGLAHRMSDLQELMLRLARREPFAYVHFNDGELHVVDRDHVTKVTDRGMQRNSKQLQQRMTAALRSDAPGLVFGLPCLREFRYQHQLAMSLVNGSHATRMTTATLFINQNYRRARPVLPALLRRRGGGLHLLVSAQANISRFTLCTDLRPTSVRRVQSIDAFPSGLTEHEHAWRDMEEGDLVIVCAGPLGRILAVEWFLRKPQLTILELGSFFDPELQPDGQTLGASFYSEWQSLAGGTTQMAIASPTTGMPPAECSPRAMKGRAQYKVRKWFKGCQARDDVGFELDVSRIFKTQREFEQRQRSSNL
eukprot:CAMPEP_0183336486 /NCGR_PEP_ID=MMETSP0164_2-20130417/4446_1 /TAXON_ID=221442 /ORGANISM="Coccolithus pelagicus ssp braarudi, Strain PLY182g" /LENGTH=739 /DNA_ID=CAMNT_0025506011 /DNA_START=297 /DNA_END=2516 /DNA_ORIENTATION=+